MPRRAYLHLQRLSCQADAHFKSSLGLSVKTGREALPRGSSFSPSTCPQQHGRIPATGVKTIAPQVIAHAWAGILRRPFCDPRATTKPVAEEDVSASACKPAAEAGTGKEWFRSKSR
jgi:hypothetical protein